MKYVCFLLLLCSTLTFSQVGIGTTNPNASLDIRSSNEVTPSNTDGLLIPKIEEFPVTNPTALQNGMIVFATGAGGVAKGFYYWDNASSSWVTFGVTHAINDLTDGKSDNDGTNNGSSIFFGINAGINDDGTDNGNVGVGFQVLQANTVGASNTAMGYQALNSNSTGTANTAIGKSSQASNTAGFGNTTIGNNSLYSNTTGYGNTVNGSTALYSNTTGFYNTVIGNSALNSNTTGFFNTVLGGNAGFNSTGDGNVYLGYNAGYIETGSNKLYIENSNANSSNALIYGEFGSDNTTAGNILRTNSEFQVNKEGTSAIQTIVAALMSNTSNRPVLQFSENATANITDGMSLEYDGRGSGPANRMVFNSVGGSPLFEFRNGGSLTLTGGSLYVNHPNGAATEGIIIRNTVDADTWRIYQQWNSNTLALMFNNVNVGNFDDVSGVYTAVSDRNLKKNISKISSVLEKVKKLEVVDYNFTYQKDLKKHLGLIAQDVEKIFPSMVVSPNEERENYTMDYSGFGVIAIKAIQEQQEKIDALEREITEIKALLEKQ